MALSYTLLSVFYLAGGIFIFLLGLTILRSGRRSSPSRATALMLFFAGVGPILSATSIILQSTLRQDAVVYRSMVENFEYLWEFYFPSLLLFSLTYPREYRWVPSFALLGIVLFAPYIFHLVTVMNGSEVTKTFMDWSKNLPLSRDVTLGERTISLGGFSNALSLIFSTLVKVHKQFFLIVNIVYASSALLFLSRNMRLDLNPRIAGQLRTVLAGITVSIFGYTVAKLGRLLPGPLGSEDVSLALINFSLVAGGGSVAYAVVKQQFLGINYIVRRSILYGAAAIFFAAIYLTVVKPVSDFFGQYSMVSKDAFETGFIILAIIAFQPILFRTEEFLEQLLLKGRDDLQTRFKNLSAAMSSVASEADLEEQLHNGFRDILDSTYVKLHLNNSDDRFRKLEPVLWSIGEPVTREELVKLGEKGLLGGVEDIDGRDRRARKERARKGMAYARSLAGSDDVLIPIMKERDIIGYVSVGDKATGMKYNTEELALLSGISSQIGVALDVIRLVRENVEKKVIEEELEIARRVQSQLLPAHSPTIPGYSLTAATLPSRHVGGDFYYYHMVDEDHLVLLVADVSGKGIPASLLTASIHAAVNSNEDARAKPAIMLGRINKLLYESTSPEEFATLFYGVVDVKSGELRYANAGHEFPYMVTAEGLQKLEESGIVLGAMLNFDYEEKSFLIPPDGSLILYTDGVTDAETTGGECFGDDRLRQALTNGQDESGDLCAAILDKVRNFSQDGDYHDDVTLVVLHRQ
jgi:serine phosphatase RsbU (regulator of sigma subunit)